MKVMPLEGAQLMPGLTSRERLLRTMQLQPADHVPCSCMSFTVLRRRCREDLYELAKVELDLGLDPSFSSPVRRVLSDLIIPIYAVCPCASTPR